MPERKRPFSERPFFCVSYAPVGRHRDMETETEAIMKTAPGHIRTGEQLEACPVCGSNLMFPLQRHRDAGGRWRLLMSCPDCFAWKETVVQRQQMLEAYCRQQDGVNRVAADLASLERRHMREECQKFIDALRDGQIMPGDF